MKPLIAYIQLTALALLLSLFSIEKDNGALMLPVCGIYTVADSFDIPDHRPELDPTLDFSFLSTSETGPVNTLREFSRCWQRLAGTAGASLRHGFITALPFAGADLAVTTGLNADKTSNIFILRNIRI